MQTMYSVKTNN